MAGRGSNINGGVSNEDFERELQDYIMRFPKQEVKINYNNSETILNIKNATPSEIKRRLNIQSGALQLADGIISYSETNDNKFDPELVAGTYTMAVIEVNRPDIRLRPIIINQVRTENLAAETNEVVLYIYDSNYVRSPDNEDRRLIRLPINSNGKICLNNSPFFRNRANRHLLFLINEDTSEIIHVDEDDNEVPCREGARYGIICPSTNQINRQSEYLVVRSEDSSNEKKIESLSNISMTRATVFWMAFPRIFFALSEIEKDYELENDIEKYKSLICPGSLKATLYQIAVSINDFVKLQADHTHALMNRELNEEHGSESVTCLKRIKSEVNDFIRLVIEHMRKNIQNKDTVTLVYKMKDLDLLDKDIELEEKKCKEEEPTDELIKDEIPKIFGESTRLTRCLKEIVSQRKALKYIFEFVDEATSSGNFNLSNILEILKLLKELIYAEIKHFLHADFIRNSCDVELEDTDVIGSGYSISKRDANRNKESCMESYVNVYEIWRTIETVSPLVVDYSKKSSDWEELRNEILNTQRITEIRFHAIMNRYSPSQL